MRLMFTTITDEGTRHFANIHVEATEFWIFFLNVVNNDDRVAWLPSVVSKIFFVDNNNNNFCNVELIIDREWRAKNVWTFDFHLRIYIIVVRIIDILRGYWENKSIVLFSLIECRIAARTKRPSGPAGWTCYHARQIDTRQRTHSPYLFRLHAGVRMPAISTVA